MAGDVNWDADWLRWKALVSVAAVPAGFGAAVGLIYVASENATNASLPAWVQAIGSVGAIVGAWLIGAHQHRKEVDVVRIAATFEIAILLRQWITAIEEAVFNHGNHLSSAGNMGEPLVTLPDLPFERTPERVTGLDPAHVRAVFDLIEIKQRANASASFIIEFFDPDEASESTFTILRGLYKGTIEVCNQLEDKVMWDRTKPDARVFEHIDKFGDKEDH